MTKSRLEAFSDGVLAIIITIMVLELHPPADHSAAALLPLGPRVLAYLLSFVFLGIYWNNHHHLFQAVERVGGSVLWANLHLLFWLSLVPVSTAWLGEAGAATYPVALYGLVLIAAGTAYFILVRALVSVHGPQSRLARAIGRDVKGKASLVLYGAALGLAFLVPMVSILLYVVVAASWFIPDRRLEKAAHTGN